MRKEETKSVRIRLARQPDVARLMEIFERARRFMQSVGNANQWINGYPQRELVERGIEAEHCYVCENEKGTVVGTFCFIQGPDPTYARIDGGRWLNDEPYYVIHRLASDGTCRGIGRTCLEWCGKQCAHLRADTHADNKVMQHLLEEAGFVRCGTIYVANGTARLAYQKQ